MCLTQAVLLLLLIFAVLQNESSSIFKMTNAQCESFDESSVVVRQCRLRAIKRNVTVLNLNIDILQPAREIHLNMAVLKKANGYKPFLYNNTIDCCAFMKKRNDPGFAIILDIFQSFSNINHTCPYVGEQILNGFYPKRELLKLPMPSGEYALMMTWFIQSKKMFHTNVYWTFSEK